MNIKANTVSNILLISFPIIIFTKKMKMKNIVRICCLFISFSSCLWMQAQNNFFNRVIYMHHYPSEQFMYNPAFAGDITQPAIQFGTRIERTDGSNLDTNPDPFTLNFNAQTPLQGLNSGIGLNFQYHRFDDSYVSGTQRLPTDKRLLSIKGAYAYTLNPGDDIYLQFGLAVGGIHFRTNESPPNVIGGGTQVVTAINENRMKITTDIGAAFFYKDFYAGFAVANFNQPEFRFFDVGRTFTFFRQLYISSGYDFNFAGKFHLSPSVMINPLLQQNSNQNLLFLDASLWFNYDKRFFVGSSYRINDGLFIVPLSAGVRLGSIYLGGSYFFTEKTTQLTNRLEFNLAFYLHD